MIARTHAEAIKFVGYRAPLGWTLAAGVVIVAWAALYGYEFSGNPDMTAPRLGAATIAGVTDFGMLLFSLATAALVICDRVGHHFPGPLVARPGLSQFYLSKTLVCALVGVLIGVLAWAAVALTTTSVVALRGAQIEGLWPVLAPMVARCALGFVLSAWIGLCWAVITRFNHRMVIAATLIWPLLVERILAVVVPESLSAYVAPYRVFGYFVSTNSLGIQYPFSWGWSWLPLTGFALILTAVAAVIHLSTTRQEEG